MTSSGSATGDVAGGSGPVARHVVVRGRVQGVYFRTSTRQMAERHGVTGWVCNRRDGTVEAWLEGPVDAVDAVEAWMVTGGPPAAEVTRVDVADGDPQGHEHFEVRRGQRPSSCQGGTSGPGR